MSVNMDHIRVNGHLDDYVPSVAQTANLRFDGARNNFQFGVHVKVYPTTGEEVRVVDMSAHDVFTDDPFLLTVGLHPEFVLTEQYSWTLRTLCEAHPEWATLGRKNTTGGRQRLASSLQRIIKDLILKLGKLAGKGIVFVPTLDNIVFNKDYKELKFVRYDDRDAAKSAEESVEKSAEKSAAKSAEESAEKSAKKSAAKSAKKSAEESVEDLLEGVAFLLDEDEQGFNIWKCFAYLIDKITRILGKNEEEWHIEVEYFTNMLMSLAKDERAEWMIYHPALLLPREKFGLIMSVRDNSKLDQCRAVNYGNNDPASDWEDVIHNRGFQRLKDYKTAFDKESGHADLSHHMLLCYYMRNAFHHINSSYEPPNKYNILSLPLDFEELFPFFASFLFKYYGRLMLRTGRWK